MNQFVTGTRIIHCKVKNENDLTNLQSESYIKEEIMTLETTEPFDDEESSAENSNLQANAFPFERSHKNESKLTYNQDESDLTNIQSETYIKEEIMIPAMDEYFDQNTIKTEQCGIKIEVTVTSSEESLWTDVTDQSDERDENDKIYNPKCAREYTNDKDKQNITSDKTKCKISPKPVTEKLKSIILVCPKCSRKEMVLSVNQTTNCQDCKDMMDIVCLMCDGRIKNISSVYYHIRNICRQKKIYQCEHCSYQGKSKDLFYRHVIRQHGSKQKCPKCGKKLTKNGMRIHKEVCGINVRYLRCIFCSFDNKYKDNLLKHIRKAHPDIKPEQYSRIIKKITKEGERIKANALNLAHGSEVNTLSRTIDFKKLIQLFCAQCNEICKNADYRSKRDCEKCGAALLFQCHNCTKRYSKIRSMRSHLHQKCAARIRFRCADCQYTSTNKRTLQIHICRKHMGLTPEDYERCSKCDKWYKFPPDRISHEKHCGRQTELQCHLCPFKSKDKSYFNLHMQDHVLYPSDNRTVFPAPTDGARIKSAKRLQHRNATINSLKPMSRKEKMKVQMMKIFCPKCNKKFKYVKRDKKQCIHCGSEKTYECDKCGKVLSRLYNLSTHVIRCHLVSELEKHLQCLTCGKRFAFYSVMQRHQKYCVKQPDEQCPHCPFRSKYPWNIASHLHKMHSEANTMASSVSLACDHCRFKTNRKDKLTIHLKRMHLYLFTLQELRCKHCGKDSSNVYIHNTHIANCSIK